MQRRRTRRYCPSSRMWYRVHIPWLRQYREEEVRLALVQARRSDVTKTADFTALLQRATADLRTGRARSNSVNEGQRQEQADRMCAGPQGRHALQARGSCISPPSIFEDRIALQDILALLSEVSKLKADESQTTMPLEGGSTNRSRQAEARWTYGQVDLVTNPSSRRDATGQGLSTRVRCRMRLSADRVGCTGH